MSPVRPCRWVVPGASSDVEMRQIVANVSDPDVPHGTDGGGIGAGTGSGGQGTFGTNPSSPTSIPGQSAPGSTPQPAPTPKAPSTTRTPLVIGLVVAILAVVGVIIGVVAH